MGTLQLKAENMNMLEQAETLKADTESNVCEFKITMLHYMCVSEKKRAHFDFSILHNKSALTG